MSTLNARHLTVDMYNCRPTHLEQNAYLTQELPALLEEEGCHILSSSLQHDDDHTMLAILLKEGHFTVHVYKNLRYAAADFYLCLPIAKPENLFKGLRKIFTPDKTKTTYLKRGDFGTERDMKPKIKTHISPLRRIHNTGEKVIRMLAHRKNR